MKKKQYKKIKKQLNELHKLVGILIKEKQLEGADFVLENQQWKSWAEGIACGDSSTDYSRDLELLTQGGNVVIGYVDFEDDLVNYQVEGGWQYGTKALFQAWRYKL